jgi:hypothetical protein
MVETATGQPLLRTTEKSAALAEARQAAVREREAATREREARLALEDEIARLRRELEQRSKP